MGRMGRINITLYSDELERASGGIWRLLNEERETITEAEEAYLVGAAMALDQLRTTLIDGDWEQFVTALRMQLGTSEGKEE